jgi:hypothetical protein
MMNKRLRLLLFVGLLVGLAMLVIPANAQRCEDYGTCTPVPPPQIIEVPSGPIFGDDGRLNPEPAEYYTVYCQNNVVEIIRAVPQPSALVASIAIQQLVSLGEGGHVTVSGVTATKYGDTISLNGGGGNAGSSGPKNFSLSQCIARNGPLPPPPPPPQPPPPTATLEPMPEGGLSQQAMALMRTASGGCCWFGMVLPAGTIGLAFRRWRRRLRGQR